MLELVPLYIRDKETYFIGIKKERCLLSYHNIEGYFCLTKNDLSHVLELCNGKNSNDFPYFPDIKDAYKALEELNFLIKMVGAKC
jgi:hypothetical protein